MKTAVLAGATGLIGNQLLSKLLASSRYDKVVAMTRRPLSMDHPYLKSIISDFQDLDAVFAGIKPDDVFCCLGTTMAKAGSKEKFCQVDFEYPYALAKTTLALGAKQYLLVSALGADKKSKIFYNKVKGEVESAICHLDFHCVHIFRPSLLLGARSEKRSGENIAKALYKTFGFLIPEKFKAIEGGKVAEAMLTFASADERGIFIHESKEMQRLKV